MDFTKVILHSHSKFCLSRFDSVCWSVTRYLCVNSTCLQVMAAIGTHPAYIKVSTLCPSLFVCKHVQIYMLHI